MIGRPLTAITLWMEPFFVSSWRFKTVVVSRLTVPVRRNQLNAKNLKAGMEFLHHSVINAASRPGVGSALSAPEEMGGLPVLPSQDRWIRIQGAIDHFKAATSSQ